MTFGKSIAALIVGIMFLSGSIIAASVTCLSDFGTRYTLSQAPISESLLYSTYFGGDSRRSQDDKGADTCIGPDGSIYCLAWTNTEYWPLVNAYQDTLQGTGDMVLMKMSADGSEYQYCSYLGGNGDDLGFQMEIDDEGNVYIAGRTDSTDLATSGSFDDTFGGGLNDGFVMKFNPTTNTPYYTTYIGGAGDDFADSLAVDASGNVYVTGWTKSSNFPAVNAKDTELSGLMDAFVLKLGPDGNEVAFSTYLGGDGADQGCDITLGLDNEILVTGQTSSDDFFCSDNANDKTLNGSNDAFLTRMSSDGSEILYSSYIGGMMSESGLCSLVDDTGDMYVTGWTRSPDFVTVNPYDGSHNGGHDVFLQKIASNGTSVLYSTYIGGSDDEGPLGMALDKWGCVYILGGTDSEDYPLANAFDDKLDGELQPGYYADNFISKLHVDTNRLLYSSYMGGDGNEYSGMLDLDENFNLVFCGETTSSDFPVTNTAYQSEFFEGGSDVYLTVLYDRGDLDGDLLLDYQETLLGTDRASNDSDFDSMPDAWEFSNGLNATYDDSSEDPDFDLLINVDEYLHGTDPNDPDSDNDSIPDGFEVAHGYNATNPDVPLDELVVYNAPTIAVGGVVVVALVFLVAAIMHVKKPKFRKEELEAESYDKDETRKAMETLSEDVPKVGGGSAESATPHSDNIEEVDNE